MAAQIRAARQAVTSSASFRTRPADLHARMFSSCHRNILQPSCGRGVAAHQVPRSPVLRGGTPGGQGERLGVPQGLEEPGLSRRGDGQCLNHGSSGGERLGGGDRCN